MHLGEKVFVAEGIAGKIPGAGAGLLARTTPGFLNEMTTELLF